MYGMINKAIEDLIRRRHGDEVWEEIKKDAGVEHEIFLSNEAYPDEITYNLVGAASRRLGTPPDDILFAFGEHWVLHTARIGYGALMEAAGSSLAEFLDNLPDFHTRVRMIFPRLVPPRFQVTDRTPTSLRLHYRTHRAGLSPFVLGLLSGLGRMFGQDMQVKHELRVSEGADHDRFLVEWKDA